jgi:hypothetical protein
LILKPEPYKNNVVQTFLELGKLMRHENADQETDIAELILPMRERRTETVAGWWLMRMRVKS